MTIPPPHDLPAALTEGADAAPELSFQDSHRRVVADLTIAELMVQFLRAPRETAAALLDIMRATGERQGMLTSVAAALGRAATAQVSSRARVMTIEERAQQQRDAVQLMLRIAAFLMALYGSSILAQERTEEFGLHVGAPYLLIGFLIWIGAELYGGWPDVLRVLRGDENRRSRPERAFRRIRDGIDGWQRALYASLAAILAVLTLSFTAGNRFHPEGVLTWFASIALITAAFAPAGWGGMAVWSWLRGLRIRISWTLIGLIVIMALGAYLRLSELPSIPPEMTSDHVEKILDAQSVLDGLPQVFFPNNGGRDPIQFYLMAFISGLPGLGMNFFTLKLLSALEGLIAIPIMWWLGRAMIGDDERDLGNAVGLVLAALVAVSYWHVALSRLGLRIVLTTVFTALVLIFFVRALRSNQRGDFIKTGLALGFGLYAYQAMRMVPVVIILGGLLVLAFRLVGYFVRRTPLYAGRTLWNFIVLVIIALVVFTPLLGFSLQYPEDFWRRTQGRLLGDDLIQTTNEQGELIQRVPTLQERLEAFRQNLPLLMNNIRNALLMYNWKGDVAWINAAPNYPAMDVVTGTLFIIGLAAWVVRMVRRRDVADWLIPPMMLVMMLPSALSIAYPIENPSATRMSGTLPPAYLFAALPLALIVLLVMRVLRGRLGQIVGVGMAATVVLAAFFANRNTYFVEYREAYLSSAPAPYTEGGRFLRGFVESGGGYGNAFMIGFPFWWDHRAIGIEAGALDWPNGIVTRDAIPRFLYDAVQRVGKYALDPDKDLLFFVAAADGETLALLQNWFPAGYAQREQSYMPGDDFMVFRVPALGTVSFLDFVSRQGVTGE
ncbi:MAG: hypothetical protein JNJ61_21140 [Anaerolineae bacterium]|nr:hypothetical protein [Anaerolineae bacterium]